ncbi:MAG: DNA mismatch repair protein, partial [Thermoanaerobaculia bacterium]|nr:DNA mismatch repair protein [Thermoanaerobaculia bacterium]
MRELVADHLHLESAHRRFTVNQEFLYHVLANPPIRHEEIHFRQQILEELGTRPEALESTHELYRNLHDLFSRFKQPGLAARLDINAYRLEILDHAKLTIDTMTADFAEAGSGLRRLSEAGRQMQESPEYELLAALLDYDRKLASLKVEINVGATGRISHLEIQGIEENSKNRFYQSPWQRFRNRLKFLFNGYHITSVELVSRLVQSVFLEVSPALTPLVQLLGQLELYLTSLSFRAEAEAHGLETCLARFDDGAPMRLENVFNPFLLRQKTIVPCRVENPRECSVTLITGPNSGGKTRLLQALGLAQLLGQSGLYVPAASAVLPIVDGMFVSLIEREAIDQAEGRLGRELMRIRSMFEAMGSRAIVILDELCSGTNPSEAIEVFSLVLRLLELKGPTAYITTHFLDFARDLEREPPINALAFLQVEIDERQQSTYQFVPRCRRDLARRGVARRLGVDLRGAGGEERS